MRILYLCGTCFLMAGAVAGLWAQQPEPDQPAATPRKHGAEPAQVLEDRFDREAPQVGDLLPDVVGLDAEGNEFPLRDLRGHYTVLTFGCLT